MSTRRARIKAVAALPVRRKNVDDKSTEKVSLSPKTPRPKLSESSVKKSPKFAQSPRALKASESIKQGSPSTFLSPGNVNKSSVISIHSERTPVITSTKNVFLSPPCKGSPRTKAIPPVSSPKPFEMTSDIDKVSSNEKGIENPKVIEKSKEFHNEQLLSEKAVLQKNSTLVISEFNPPSVPESITDESGMDGIVPLQPVNNVPVPIALLKNEIISENAEVLFDPIVPLPSPSKVRPKLRPVPRLAPLRRNSIQGSASESEDESRRALHSAVPTHTPARTRHESHTTQTTVHPRPNKETNRVRNDSVSSSVSQVPSQPPHAASPTKHLTKHRRTDMQRRAAAMRRGREAVKQGALTMYDLIFYNPTDNPIVPDQDEVKAKEENQRDEADKKAKEKEPAQVTEDNPDGPPDAAPVPQIKLGPNGEIILDEKSLVIKQTEGTRKVADGFVREGAWGGGGGKYTRGPRTADWSDVETVRFYRALAAVGTDFTLMAPLFPGRNRKDLKLKFKKEERHNGAQVDKALRSGTTWDATRLSEEFTEERAEDKRLEEDQKKKLMRERWAEKERLKKNRHLKLRRSKASKSLETTSQACTNGSAIQTADDVIYQSIQTRQKNKMSKRKLQSAPNVNVAHHPHYATLTLVDKVQQALACSVNTQNQNNINQMPGMAVIQKNPTTASQILSNPIPPIALNQLLNLSNTTPQKVIPQITSTSLVNTLLPVQPNAKLPPPIRNKNTSRIPNLVPISPQIPTTSQTPSVPANVENGSLVVLTVSDPSDPTKKMLQTYISKGKGILTPISLPPALLKSVVGYMKQKEITSPVNSSPRSVGSRGSTPSVIQANPSPNKRQRISSFCLQGL